VSKEVKMAMLKIIAKAKEASKKKRRLNLIE